jgi:LTXXQ motif family protein
MTNNGIRMSAILLASVMAFTCPIDAMAAGKAGGGGGHPGGGGGGGAHFGGGSRGGGPAHIHTAPSMSRSSARRSSSGNRALAVHTAPGGTVGHRAPLNTGRTATSNPRVNHGIHDRPVRNALNSRSVEGALRNRSELHNPNNRARISAAAAAAGWHNGREGGHGWWRHGNGGYGWVGPLYWPFAYNDMYDYAMWGDGYDDSFWGYGYGDIYTGMFAPYGYDDLTGYLPQYAGTNPRGTGDTTGQASPAATPPKAGALTQMCGDDSRDIAGLPIDQIQQTIQLNDAQRAALDDLANASAQAAQGIMAACPTDITLTAPSRLAHMQQRIEAMIAAVEIVQPPLERYYGLLSDEQKLRLTALGQDQRQGQTAQKTATSLAQTCGAAQPGGTVWPTAEIDRTVRPTEAQRASLVTLEDETTKAADMLKASCPPNNSLTPPARLASVGKRLDTMLQAVKTVRSGLDGFYGALSDEQKAKFEAIGSQRTSESDHPKARQVYYRGRNVEGDVQSLIRHLLPF